MLYVQPHHVGAVHAKVGRVVVKERKRAGQLCFLVDHLEQYEVMLQKGLPGGALKIKKNSPPVSLHATKIGPVVVLHKF